ncbi:Tn3 family transposase [Deinococcus sp.]|uniref:Tn3 family transposase n=1 Tax=Deinococcus sp. TaxID=47478 RepID=UPI0025FD63BB|nr:Tn3 family transposase [Deinococcus sp.]
MYPTARKQCTLNWAKPGRWLAITEYGDNQAQSFSALAVLHNAVVTWNMTEIEGVVARLRADGHELPDEVLSLTTPLLRKHINPFGRYHFDLGRLGG